MAKLIDGKAVSARLRQEMKAEVEALKEKGITPGLAVVLVGEDPASQVYVAGKERDCAECGIESFSHRLGAETTEDELLALAQRLWQFPPVGAIQSELELDGPTVGLEALGRGESPILDPFAILGPDYSPKEEGLRVTALARGRPGLLVQEGVPRRHWI